VIHAGVYDSYLNVYARFDIFTVSCHGVDKTGSGQERKRRSCAERHSGMSSRFMAIVDENHCVERCLLSEVYLIYTTFRE
jgi:hypothetical protein